jgi:hypothetical protein
MPKLFGWLPKNRWLRWLIILFGSGFLLLVVLIVAGYFLLQQPAVQSRLMSFFLTAELYNLPPVPPEPSLSDADLAGLARYAAEINSVDDLFATTNVWDVHFRFTAEEWEGLRPERIAPVSPMINERGQFVLNNPNASRPGLAGVLGIDLPWSKGTVEFGGVMFSNSAIRFKGNGTFLSGMGTYKRPYKLDLNDHVKGQKIAGRTKLNFGNLLAEFSMLTDTLGFEFYREAGVPSVRTAFARVLLSIEGAFEERLLGLYVLIEDPGKEWAEDVIGTKGVAVFKPVTYEPFRYLGEDWADYDRIYNAKTDTTPEQQRRLIDFTRLVSEADKQTYGREIADYLDLEKFATWLACESLLANYDGFFTTGQNYLVYLDPKDNRFSFAPWDLDHSWGEFPFVATADQRERASVMHPWTLENRFLERLMNHEPFVEIYRGELERLRAELFQPERLAARVDELAAIVRPFIAEESDHRLTKFDASISDTWGGGPRDGDPMDPDRPAYPLKRFFEARAESVQAQLAGETDGLILPGMGKP